MNKVMRVNFFITRPKKKGEIPAVSITWQAGRDSDEPVIAPVTPAK